MFSFIDLSLLSNQTRVPCTEATFGGLFHTTAVRDISLKCASKAGQVQTLAWWQSATLIIFFITLAGCPPASLLSLQLTRAVWLLKAKIKNQIVLPKACRGQEIPNTITYDWKSTNSFVFTSNLELCKISILREFYSNLLEHISKSGDGGGCSSSDVHTPTKK